MGTLYELFKQHEPIKFEAMYRIYDLMMPHFFPNPREVKKVLEIGIAEGKSLMTYRDYFTNATIYGLDVVDCKSQESERIRIFQGDQANSEDLDLVIEEGPFDLVVDDGGHQAHQQVFSFFYLFPHVKPQGLYVVEDVGTAFWPKYSQGQVTIVDVINQCNAWLESNGVIAATRGSRWENEAKESCVPPQLLPQVEAIGPLIASVHVFPTMLLISRTPMRQTEGRSANLWRHFGSFLRLAGRERSRWR